MSNPVPYSPVFSWDQTRYRGCSHMDSVANVQQFCDKVDRSVKSLGSVLGIYLDCRCITITSTNFFFFFFSNKSGILILPLPIISISLTQFKRLEKGVLLLSFVQIQCQMAHLGYGNLHGLSVYSFSSAGKEYDLEETPAVERLTINHQSLSVVTYPVMKAFNSYQAVHISPSCP